MRCELVFGAMGCVSNRFLLIKAASTATRKFDRPRARIEDTLNDVLVRFTWTNPIRRVERTHAILQTPEYESINQEKK